MAFSSVNFRQAKVQKAFSSSSPVILFDFDGTLVNTTPLILRSFHATWEKEFGFTFDDATYIQTFGRYIHAALKDLITQSATEGRIAAPTDLDAKAVEVLKTYRAFNLAWHDQIIEPFAGIDEALQELKAHGMRMGIVSSKMRFGVERGLQLFALTELFEVIIAGDDVTNHKPHPEPLLKALEKFGAPVEHAIYVGDSVHDIVAGQAAQIRTAGAVWGPFPRASLEELQPNFLLEKPQDLPTLCQAFAAQS